MYLPLEETVHRKKELLLMSMTRYLLNPRKKKKKKCCDKSHKRKIKDCILLYI